MKRTGTGTGVRRKNLLLKIGFSIFVGYVVFVLLQLQIDIRTKERELEEIRTQCMIQQGVNEDLEAFLEAGNDQELIEKIAREKLGYAYPGEKVFYDSARE